MADKFHSDTQEKIESITYQPNLQDSGDLEASTKTITATSKQGSPDYTASLTIPAPPDSRLTVTQLGLRGNIHIDSFAGSPAATKLYCAVECNGVEKVSAVELTSAGGDSFFAVDITADFNVGAANELKVYLWVDQGNAVISVCQLWLAVGSCNTPEWDVQNSLQLAYCGQVLTAFSCSRVGTGTPSARLYQEGGSPAAPEQVISGINPTEGSVFVNTPGLEWAVAGTVDTDLNYIWIMTIVLRSLQ